MAAITVLGPFGIPLAARTQYSRNAVAVVTGGSLAKKQRRQWYILPNGMRVQTTEEGYRRLLLRDRQARQEAASAPAEVSAPIAVKAKAPRQVPPAAEPAHEPAAPLAPGVLLGQPKIEAVGRAPIGDATALLIAKRTLDDRSVQERERALFEERRRQAEQARRAAEDDDALEDQIIEMLIEEMAQ